MDELLRLLAEFGADDEIQGLATRFGQTVTRDEEGNLQVVEVEGVEPLTSEELDNLLAALMALADDDEASVALLTEAANAADTIRGEQERREVAAAAEEEELARERARLRGEQAPDADNATDEDDTEGEVTDEGDNAEGDGANDGETDNATDEGDTEGEGTDEGEGAEGRQPEPVGASGARRTARRQLRRPAGADPAPNGQEGARITIGADVPGIAAGATVATLRDVDRAIMRRADAFRRSQAVGREELAVATIHANYPEDRRLTDDPSHNARVIEAALSGRTTPQAIAAAGGLCAPLTPYYGVNALGNANRPVRAALPGFQATRGGIISVEPPSLADVAGSAIQWTAENDADPDDPATKPCIVVDCGEQRTTEMYAVPLCLEFGNFRARTFAEWDAAVTELSLTGHARVAEQLLLGAIELASSDLTDDDTVVSAYRDWLAMLIKAVTQYRVRVRDEDLQFRAIAPSQAPAIFAIDFLRGMAGGVGYAEVLRRGRSEIAADLAAHGINVTWSPDMNVPGPQGAGTVVAELPPEIDTALYPEGTFLFLDGGTLDLGPIRDSTLIGTNSFQTFVENFEGLHHLGHQAYWLTANVCPSGAVNGTLDPAALCASYT